MTFKRDWTDPPWYVKVVGTFYNGGLKVEPLDPPARAYRVVQHGRFDYVGEAMHPSGNDWVEMTPHCWFRWQARRWLSFYDL